LIIATGCSQLAIELDEPTAPPDCAVAERQLLDVASEAAGVFSQRFIRLISHKSARSMEIPNASGHHRVSSVMRYREMARPTMPVRFHPFAD
jgi:hypothetical protein